MVEFSMARIGCAVAGALVASVVGIGSATANPYTLAYDPNGAFLNGGENVDLQLGATSIQSAAGGIWLQATDQATSVSQIVQAWCIDIYDDLNLPATFTEEPASAVLDPTTLSRISALISNGAPSTTNPSTSNNVSSAALQIAIWEVEYETTGTFNVSNGSFQLTGSGYGSLAAVTAQANLDIQNVLSGTWAASTNYSYVAAVDPADSNQTLILAVPVSEASAASVMLAGIVGMAFIRRRSTF